MLRGLVTAFRTLTLFPVPGREADTFSSSLPWFPVVGLILGGCLYGLVRFLAPEPLRSWPEALAVIVLIASAVLTRGLHLDGLADWADGFWGGHTREDILRIMHDPRVGSFGVIALVCVLLAKWVCLTRLVAAAREVWIVTALVISRTLQALLMSFHPYARTEGGTAGAFVREARPFHGLSAVLVGIGILSGWHARVAEGAVTWLWLPGMAVGWVVMRAFGLWARHRLGGITGDMIGACSELVETAVLGMGVLGSCL